MKCSWGLGDACLLTAGLARRTYEIIVADDHQNEVTDMLGIAQGIFKRYVATNLETIRQDFESRRMLVKMLDVQARFIIEAGQKIAYVRAKLRPDEKRLSIETEITRNSRL